MRGWLPGLALLLGATDVRAEVAPGATTSLQALFNQASQDAGDGKCAAALPVFAQLAEDRRVRAGSIPAGAIAVRRGSCLVATGSRDEGERSIRAGLPILEKADRGFDAEVVQAYLVLGELAEARWSHDEAVTAYTAALARRTGADRIQALMLRAKVRAFDAGPEALADVDEALALLAAMPKPDRMTQASFRTMRGRILMNRGANREALAELKQALDLSGGLTNRISLNQVAIRGDLAQAEMLNGNKDQARLYLAYTGAGRIEESPFLGGDVMEPPPCGAQTGLSPGDAAIVEFSIGDAGDVQAARTVYSRGNYEVAAAFARAVAQWHWRPEKLARVPAFYRVLSRIELRCSVAGGARPEVVAPIVERFDRWAEGQLHGEANLPGVGARLARLDAIAADGIAAGKPLRAIAALGTRGLSDPQPEGQLASLDRALALGPSAGLPAEIGNALTVLRGKAKRAVDRGNRVLESRSVVQDMLALASSSGIAADPLAQATVRLMAVPVVPPAAERELANATLAAVADDSRLAEHHPLRQLAMLQLANIAADARQFDRAQDWFRRTGLSEQQCALIGPQPAMRATGAGGEDYPAEALRMGFEGWVRLEYDISADGRAVASRPIVAYPPIVFAEAANGMARGFRFTTSYRPAGGEACSANQSTINFRLNR
ncbi:MAG: energy transducer TonB [Sphingomonadales bacterium]|nr:energy transducer TonB [Sphingomonadales bacterium]